MQYSFQKRTQFSQGINVLDVPAYNIYVFLLTYTCLYSTQLSRLIWKKCAFLPLENTDAQTVFYSKPNSVHTEKQYATCSSF
jgi:hypothetical protein